MKKQISFYILWDVLFTVFLYAYCNINSWAKHSYYKGANVYLVILMLIILSVMIGIFISWLGFISNQYQFTKKLAVLELVIIGGLALYLTTTLLLPTFIMHLTGGSIPKFAAIWWSYDNTPTVIGSLLLGYELFIFIIRMIKFKQIQTPAEPE